MSSRSSKSPRATKRRTKSKTATASGRCCLSSLQATGSKLSFRGIRRPTMTTSSEKQVKPLVVNPHMVERVAPAYYDRVNREHRPERRWMEQHGWDARQGTLTTWSLSRDAACHMLGFMEGSRREVPNVHEYAPDWAQGVTDDELLHEIKRRLGYSMHGWQESYRS